MPTIDPHQFAQNPKGKHVTPPYAPMPTPPGFAHHASLTALRVGLLVQTA